MLYRLLHTCKCAVKSGAHMYSGVEPRTSIHVSIQESFRGGKLVGE